MPDVLSCVASSMYNKFDIVFVYTSIRLCIFSMLRLVYTTSKIAVRLYNSYIMSKKCITFVALNIKSLYPSIDEVRCKLNNYDIFGICETWLIFFL